MTMNITQYSKIFINLVAIIILSLLPSLKYFLFLHIFVFINTYDVFTNSHKYLQMPISVK